MRTQVNRDAMGSRDKFGWMQPYKSAGEGLLLILFPSLLFDRILLTLAPTIVPTRTFTMAVGGTFPPRLHRWTINDMTPHPTLPWF